MRMVVMLLLGMFIGAFGAVTAVSALRQTTPLTKATMAVTGSHFNQLRQLAKTERCDAALIEPHLQTMRALSSDLDSVFLPTGGDDEAFRRHRIDYRHALDAALSPVAQSCAALDASIASVGAKCKACHQEFRH